MKKIIFSTFYFLLSRRRAQSLIEVLIAAGIGALLIIAAAAIITPALRGNTQAIKVQAGAALGRELLDNVRVWAEGDWHNILNISTTSASKYYIIASSSPFTATSGTESVIAASTTITRYFYADDVYRDPAGKIVTTGVRTYDPSTKQVTVAYSWPQSATATLSVYLTRNRTNIFDQTDWSGGPNQGGPATTTNNKFNTSSKIAYSSAGSISIVLAPVYVQGTGASNPDSSANNCSSTFLSANNAGDLIVVGVGWDSGALVTSSVSDANGNTYVSAVGPTQNPGGGFTNTIQTFYAQNVVAGANTITAAVTSPGRGCQVNIQEYGGMDTSSPLDVISVATGTSGNPDSGSATTNNAKELIFGFIATHQAVGGDTPGNGFTSRNSTDTTLTEDKTVSAIGTYSASAFAVSSTAGWAAQMSTYKAVQ